MKESLRPQESVCTTVTIWGATVYSLNNKASLIVPVNIVQRDINLSSQALIDSGAQGNFIDSSLADNFILECLPNGPLGILNVDGSPNQGGPIKYKTMIKVIMGDQPFWIEAMVASLGKDRIILGDTWLRDVNPQIDWPRDWKSVV